MKQSSIILLGSGLLIGFIVGSTVRSHHATESASPESSEQRLAQFDNGTLTSKKSEQRHHGSRDLLSQTQAELDAVRERLRALEKSAARYEWLQKNGMQTYGLMFERDTFTPQPQLMEFMGLNETESDQLCVIASTANKAIQDWELANARCTEDTPTNCVYELPPLPGEYKENFIQELATLFDPDDMETMQPLVDKLYVSQANKRTASLRYVSKDEYLQRMGPHFQSGNVTYTDMLELKIQRYDESGNQSGNTSSMFSIDHANVTQARWAHLFKYGEVAE